jgi:hypothetical protein
MRYNTKYRREASRRNIVITIFRGFITADPVTLRSKHLTESATTKLSSNMATKALSRVSNQHEIYNQPSLGNCQHYKLHTTGRKETKMPQGA